MPRFSWSRVSAAEMDRRSSSTEHSPREGFEKGARERPGVERGGRLEENESRRRSGSPGGEQSQKPL